MFSTNFYKEHNMTPQENLIIFFLFDSLPKGFYKMLLHSHYVTHLCVQPSLRVFLGVFYIYSYKILGIKSPDYTEMIQYQIVIKKYHTQENLSIFSFLIPSQEVSIKCSLQIVIKKIISHPQENLIIFPFLIPSQKVL